ncbi:MAG: hypothetical protein AAGA85_26615 [Bacteroidota bacterium]
MLLDSVLPAKRHEAEQRDEKFESFFWSGNRNTNRQVFTYLVVDGYTMLVEELTDQLFEANELTLHLSPVFGQVKRFETDQIPATFTRNFWFGWILLTLASICLVVYHQWSTFPLFEIGGYAFFGMAVYVVLFL